MSSAVFVATLAVLCVAVTVMAAKCPTGIKPMKNFDLSRIRGQWFVQKGSVNGLVAPNGKCMMRSYTPGDNNTLALHIDYLDKATGEPRNANYEFIANPSTPSILTTKDDYVNDVRIFVSTDYERFGVFYACISLAKCQGSFVAGITRERKMSRAVERLLDAELKKAGLARGIVTLDQENCD